MKKIKFVGSRYLNQDFDNIFQDLNQLESLDLENNKFSILIFKESNQLLYLSLNSNEISSITHLNLLKILKKLIL